MRYKDKKEIEFWIKILGNVRFYRDGSSYLGWVIDL